MLQNVSAQTQPSLQSTPGSNPLQGGTGKLIGRAVVEVITPQSILQDAMEELSFNFNKSDDYALKNRKERDSADRSLKDRLKAFSKIVADRDQDVLDELTQAIEQTLDRESILDRFLNEYQEPAEAWAALQEAREKLAQKGVGAEVLKEVDEALAAMDVRYGAAIRAGVCGTLTAAEKYVSLGAPCDLGADYRKATLEFSKTLDLYTFIQEKYGGNFDQAVDFLYTSLAADMGCDKPSQDLFALQSVNTSFGRLRSFQSANALLTKQLTRWENVHGVKDCPVQSVGLLGKILDMSNQSYLGASSASALANEAAAPDLERRIYFLQELLQNIRTFSPLVFDNQEGRTRIIDAVQGAVDNAVAEEDAMLSEG